jgi:hypothetical protein
MLAVLPEPTMANDAPPPSSPQQFSSARNEQKGVLTEREEDTRIGRRHPAQARAMPRRGQSRDQGIDNEALFIQCMPDPARRRIAFDIVARNCREVFPRGEEGLALFLRLRDLVEGAQVEDAVREFDERFASMLDQKLIEERLRGS